MQLVIVILLTHILLVSSFSTNRAINVVTEQSKSGRVKRDWWKNLGSKIGSFFYGHYGGGTNNNYGGTNIGRVDVVNYNFSFG